MDSKFLSSRQIEVTKRIRILSKLLDRRIKEPEDTDDFFQLIKDKELLTDIRKGGYCDDNCLDKLFDRYDVHWIREKDGFYVLADIAKIFGMSNPSVLRQDICNDYVSLIDMPGHNNSMIKMIGVSEPGLFQLIFKSYNPDLKEIKKTALDVIMGSIRMEFK